MTKYRTMYRKVANCGPVPYPDRSGRFLNDGEVVEGDDWAGLVAIGYVVQVIEEQVEPVVEQPKKTPAPKREPKVEAVLAPAADSVSEPKIEEPKVAILNEETEGVSNVMQTNDGAGAKEVDPPEAGKPSDKGLSGRPSTRRRS